MLRKLLLVFLCILIGYGVYISVSEGSSFIGFKIPSYQTLVKGNENLDTKIEELNKLNDVSYPSTERRLQSAKNEYGSKKKDYEILAASASKEEVAEANKKEQYMLDFLWMKIGTYANANDVKIKINPDVGTPVVSFDVTGKYISIINFVYDLENDAELAFNVDNIVMQVGSSDSSTKATFKVTGVNIITTEENV